MIYRKNESKVDIPTKGIEGNVHIPNAKLEDRSDDGSKSPHIFVIAMLATTGCIFFMVGLKNLCNIHRYQYSLESDSLAWTTSCSVVIFGLMAVIVAYCSYCAVFIRDLGVAVLVLTMQNIMIIIQLLTANHIKQMRLTWHSILGHLIKTNDTLKIFVGAVFVIHAFSWVFSYRLCDNLISEKEQQPDHYAKELQGAKWNKYLNFGALVACLVTFILVETDTITLHYTRNVKY
ncbi:uncharacterized protein LOC129573021 isoform X1 [Sitodiplosis mosellana]|uniref:uncharacterized protein LOC129573021 isoform X1 n=1 Tax=Sitodiplosis mosellana TaxID=263140 RepID=UPI002443C371|nr:uncharacterized protein LOC129573021 isoform X1 [Sitodiplosis mosellana]